MSKSSNSGNSALDVTQSYTVLQEAHDLINGDRRAAYGDPRDSLSSVAEFWSGYLFHRFGMRVVIDNVDVCQMMALLKMSRELTGESKRDNLVDQAGYLGLAGKVKYEMGGT